MTLVLFLKSRDKQEKLARLQETRLVGVKGPMGGKEVALGRDPMSVVAGGPNMPRMCVTCSACQRKTTKCELSMTKGETV